MDTIGKLLQKIKDAHPYWVQGEPEYRQELEKVIEPTILALEGLGVDRSFTESCLFFGKEFVDSLKENEAKKPFSRDENGLRMVGEQGSIIGENKQIFNKNKEVEEKSLYWDAVEKIFGNKIETRTEHEERCFQLAQKHNIKFFDILSKEGQSPKIKDISFNKKK